MIVGGFDFVNEEWVRNAVSNHYKHIEASPKQIDDSIHYHVWCLHQYSKMRNAQAGSTA